MQHHSLLSFLDFFKENVQKRPDVPHSGRVDHGLDVPPTLEELGADTSTLTSTLMQVNVLSDREIKAESDASDIHLRQSVKSDILIPAVGVRPGITVDMTQPTCYNNVLDEVTNHSVLLRLIFTPITQNAISQAFQQVIRPSSQQQPPSQISLSPDAASVLSQGIQFHLTYLIDAAIIHSRKRTNRTATEHFTKSQQLIAKDLPNSAPGEVAPENRGNLGMLWGPPRLEELEEFMMKTNDQYHQMKSQVTNIIKQELTADDERRQQKKKGQGTTSEHLNWWNQDVL